MPVVLATIRVPSAEQATLVQPESPGASDVSQVVPRFVVVSIPTKPTASTNRFPSAEQANVPALLLLNGPSISFHELPEFVEKKNRKRNPFPSVNDASVPPSAELVILAPNQLELLVVDQFCPKSAEVYTKLSPGPASLVPSADEANAVNP